VGLKQKNEQLDKIMAILRKTLFNEKLLTQHVEDTNQLDILVYGSAANGLFMPGSSDLDLTLVVRPPSTCTDIP
jgi:predicted nucleotidyltransferase